MYIEQKLSRFLSEMVLAPSLGLKKVRYNIQRCCVYCNGLFLYYILENQEVRMVIGIIEDDN